MSETNSDSWTGCGLKGCMLWGCITIVIIGVIGTGASIFAFNKAVSTINKYLDDKPAEFTLPAPTEDQVNSAAIKGKSLQDAIENQSGGTFAFTDAEINAMISEGLKKQGATKIKARVTIADGEVKGEISVPVEELFPQAKDKHLNGEATFEVKKASRKDQLQIKLTDLTVRGESIPKNVMNSLKTANLAEEIYTNPENHEARKVLENVESITVEGDQIIFRVSEPENATEE